MNSPYLDPSPVADSFISHTEALKPCAELPVDKCFTLRATQFHLSLLRELVDADWNVGKVAIVVIKHPEVYEVRRLADGSNVKLFYKNLEPVQFDKACYLKLTKTLCEYLHNDAEDSKKYMMEIKDLTALLVASGVLSFSYLQRRLVNVACFKNNTKGANLALKEAIDQAIKKGILIELNADDVKNKYEINSQLFEIRREILTNEQ